MGYWNRPCGKNKNLDTASVDLNYQPDNIYWNIWDNEFNLNSKYTKAFKTLDIN